MLITLVGANFGFMWGSLVYSENNCAVSALIYISLAALGAGSFVNLGTPSAIVKFISTISPLRYSVERVFRRIVSKNTFEHVLLSFFSFNAGDLDCIKIMAGLALGFFFAGWALLVYRSNRL